MTSAWATALTGLGAGTLLVVWVTLTSRRIRRAGRPSPLQHADAIVVFGDTESPLDTDAALHVRAAHAAQLYHAGWASTILCTGARRQGRSQAALLRGLLIEAGVEPSVVLPDDGGGSTRQAIEAMQGFAKQRGWSQVIAVSSPQRMYRIGWEARRRGMAPLLSPEPRPAARTPGQLWRALRQHVTEVFNVHQAILSAGLAKVQGHRQLRPLRRGYQDLAARVRWFAGEADAVVTASDALGEELKQSVRGFSEAVAVTTPAAADLAWPYPLHVTSHFGIRHRRLHGGIDIRSSYGLPVRAVTGGRIVIADCLAVYGNVCAIDHGGGLTTVYAHQAGLVVHKGETVQAGQILGFTGTTGRSFGPHVHFEVRVHGSPVDPQAYLR
jgi:murein DD-endopeptidase MepM/ murein hydrolase activator NlpD